MLEEFRKQINNYLTEIDFLDQSDEISLRNKYLQLKQVLERSCKELTQGESLQFSSLFARLVFVAQAYNLPKSLEWNLQNIRVKFNFLLENEDNRISEKQYQKARNTLDAFYSILSGLKEDIELEEEDLVSSPSSLDKLRVQLKSIHPDEEYLLCYAEDISHSNIRVRYNTKQNEQFNSTIAQLWEGAQLNLLDIELDGKGYYIPKSFILEPDYLIDASAIAECFQPFATSHLQYFRRRFGEVPNSHYILLGNLANFFLDEIVYFDDLVSLEFNDVFLKSFQQMPFEYSSCKDIETAQAFREFMLHAQSQFENIKRVVQYDMPQNGFDANSISLEPSFFSEKYGFQGRLDLLQLAKHEEDKDRIIELKSGKAPFPSHDPSIIAANHEVQTLVYRLLIQSVFDRESRDIYPTILYSSVENQGENIRWSAYYQKLEKELLNLRNLIVATEHSIYRNGSEAVAKVFDELLDVDNYQGSRPQFFLDELDELENRLKTSSELEKSYFYRFISFISRELYLQKTGDEGIYTAMSQSALWNKSFQERKDALELISNLEIQRIEETEHDMIIHFVRNQQDTSSNFREGEICILYPREKAEDTILTNQILKATVMAITSSSLVLRFRYKQRNKEYFHKYKYWAVEHDKLDHNYNAMYRSLYSFLESDTRNKNLILGIEEPSARQLTKTLVEPISIEEHNDALIERVLTSEDYFLIVGPPGTGKTSVFARRLIEELHKDESKNILVIAYTNRAIDELCASICSAFGKSDESCSSYIRIGSSLSCNERYSHRLLQNISYTAKNRQSLLNTINKTRIFVGTLASILGKPEIFELKQFHTAIIDEASQILEPQIVGLLPKFNRFIMIGDHKQLSTITLQNPLHSAVKEEILHSIDLTDCRDSLFERLFRLCQSNNWTHAYDTLSYHGRMHKDIAAFVDTAFYDNSLIEIQERQRENLSFSSIDGNNSLESWLAQTRLGFVPIRKERIEQDAKINEEEAEQLVGMIESLFVLYKKNSINFFADKTIGVITPYRNQIAIIKDKLRATNIPQLAEIMVDTVERYQGSQKDIILVSFCMSQAYQLSHFSNMNRDKTVDRKLNVAITRAREQLFLLGDEAVLSTNPIYKKLLGNCSHFIK